MYDLLNEPNNSELKGKPSPQAAAVCALYDRLYRAIRAVDPDHAIAMEGVWDWHSLRDPARSGYQNVVYSFHWYNFAAKTTADRNSGTDRDLKGLADMHAKWNVPAYVGEFNLFGDSDAWKYALDQYNQQRLAWTMWTYKNKAGGTNSWGVYTTIPGKAPPIPNLTTDAADDIRAKWKAWATTPETFALNPMLTPLLAGALAPNSAESPQK
jgi:endoglucanase